MYFVLLQLKVLNTAHRETCVWYSACHYKGPFMCTKRAESQTTAGKMVEQELSMRQC
jgi:hypothetical protein